MKILFFGSSDYCLPILETLYKNFHLAGVITKSYQTQTCATTHHIPAFTPTHKTELLNLDKKLRDLEPDIAIVADYGLIIPRDIFTIPKMSTLNIHFSKLPKLRGASPVQFTLLLGEKSAWTTVIIMDETMDTGDIIWQKKYPLSEKETTGSLYKKLFNNVASELPDIIYQYAAGKLKPQKQNHQEATYTRILTREDGFIPTSVLNAAIKGESIDDKDIVTHWSLIQLLSPPITMKQFSNVAIFIERAVRAFSPWPGLWTTVHIPALKQLKRLKILKAHLEPTASQGETLRGYHDQLLILDIVQLEGKNPVSWRQFVEGHPHFSFT